MDPVTLALSKSYTNQFVGMGLMSDERPLTRPVHVFSDGDMAKDGVMSIIIKGHTGPDGSGGATHAALNSITLRSANDSVVAVIDSFPTLRSVPSGISDTYDVRTGKVTRNVGEFLITGQVGSASVTSTYADYHRVRFLNWATNNNALYPPEGYGYCADGDYEDVQVNFGNKRMISIYEGNLYVFIEKVKADSMPGETTLEKCLAYLNLYPITFLFRLANPLVEQVRPYPLWTLAGGSAIVDGSPLVETTYRYTLDVVSLLGKDFRRDDVFVVDSHKLGVVYSAPTIPAQSLGNQTSEQLLGLYDSLLTDYPDYVTRIELGENSLGQKLYRYDFKAPEVRTVSSISSVKTPKVILLGGVHNEKAGSYCLYQAMKQICESWETSPTLEALRWDVHFIVVPVVNRYGFDNNTRGNENGVDIARNFPTDWSEGEQGTPTYGGPHPLSELETQYVNSLLEANKDAIWFSSYHNFFGEDDHKSFIWLSSATLVQVQVVKRLISALSRKWKSDHPDVFPQDTTTYVGFAELNAPPGSESRHAAALGIQAGTFEISQSLYWEGDPTSFSSLTLTLGTEAFINYLALGIRVAADYYNNRMNSLVRYNLSL